MIDTKGSKEWNGKTTRRGKSVVAFDGVTVRSLPYEEDRYDMLNLHATSMTKSTEYPRPLVWRLFWT